MSNWSVLIETAGPSDLYEPDVDDEMEDKVDDLIDGLAEYGPSVSYNAHKLSVRLSVPADSYDPAGAATQAQDLWKQFADKVEISWPIVRLEVVAGDVLEAELANPAVPELLGVKELADQLGVSRQRASELARSSHFPTPSAILASGPIWTAAAVATFLALWERRAGRPRNRCGVRGETIDGRGRVCVLEARHRSDHVFQFESEAPLIPLLDPTPFRASRFDK